MTTTTILNCDKYNKEVMDLVMAEALIIQFTKNENHSKTLLRRRYPKTGNAKTMTTI